VNEIGWEGEIGVLARDGFYVERVGDGGDGGIGGKAAGIPGGIPMGLRPICGGCWA